MNNIAAQDSAPGLPSIPSLISHASGLFGSGNFDFHTLSSLGSLARGESTLVHLLSGGWPVEEELTRTLPDGGTLCSTPKQSNLQRCVSQVREKDSDQKEDRDADPDTNAERRETHIGSIASLGPLASWGDLPQSPPNDEPSRDRSAVRVIPGVPTQFQVPIVRGRVRMELPTYRAFPVGDVHQHLGLQRIRDFVDDLYSPRLEQLQEVCEAPPRRAAHATADSNASPASLASGRTMFDTEGARQHMVSAPVVGGDDMMVLDGLREPAAADEDDRHASRKADWAVGDAGSADVEKPGDADKQDARDHVESADSEFDRPLTRSFRHVGASMSLRNARKGTARTQTKGTKSGEKVTKTRSSKYRGVTKHRRSGRWEAHVWVKELGRQVYLGGYEQEEHAAEAYDVAILKCKGRRVTTNFEISRYVDLLDCMDAISLEELIMAVRRQSQGFARGTSTFRGVTRHPSARWEARIGIPGSKHIYLGLFHTEEEAARAYDTALVRLRGSAAATNFALSDYRSDLAAYHKMQQVMLQSTNAAKVLDVKGLHFENWIKNGILPEADALAEPIGPALVVSARPQRRAAASRITEKHASESEGSEGSSRRVSSRQR